MTQVVDDAPQEDGPAAVVPTRPSIHRSRRPRVTVSFLLFLHRGF